MTSILQHIDWLNGRVPDAVRAHLRQLVAVVGFLPHKQPLAVVTADAVLLAANRPFLDLLGASRRRAARRRLGRLHARLERAHGLG